MSFAVQDASRTYETNRYSSLYIVALCTECEFQFPIIQLGSAESRLIVQYSTICAHCCSSLVVPSPAEGDSAHALDAVLPTGLLYIHTYLCMYINPGGISGREGFDHHTLGSLVHDGRRGRRSYYSVHVKPGPHGVPRYSAWRTGMK